MWMNENEACWSQVHVTAFWCLRVKLKKRAFNRRLKPILRGGVPSSHPTPNHVIGKWAVNTAFMKGHHAQPQRSARNFLIFYTIAERPFITHYYFLTGEDDYSQDQFLAIQDFFRKRFLLGPHWTQKIRLKSCETARPSSNEVFVEHRDNFSSWEHFKALLLKKIKYMYFTWNLKFCFVILGHLNSLWQLRGALYWPRES